MTDPRVPLVLDLQWVKQRRDRGALIWVLDQTGTSWHADSGVSEAIGRDVPDNGLQAIHPAHTATAGPLLRRWFGRDVTAWLPIADGTGEARWFRAEVHWINVFLVLALWPETDAAKHRVRVDPL